MSKRTLLLLANAAAVLTVAVTLIAQSPEPFFGTWKADTAKSKYSPGPAPKTNTKKYEPYKGGLRATQELVTAKGETRHVEVIAQFDGKDYPGTGNPEADSYAFKKIDAHNYEVTQKKDGKVTVSSKMVIAPDGKSRTVTQSGKNAKGEPVNNTVYWIKQ
jgi:hypothetical protein